MVVLAATTDRGSRRTRTHTVGRRGRNEVVAVRRVDQRLASLPPEDSLGRPGAFIYFGVMHRRGGEGISGRGAGSAPSQRGRLHISGQGREFPPPRSTLGATVSSVSAPGRVKPSSGCRRTGGVGSHGARAGGRRPDPSNRWPGRQYRPLARWRCVPQPSGSR